MEQATHVTQNADPDVSDVSVRCQDTSGLAAVTQVKITVITRLAVEVYFLRASVSHRSPAPTDRPAPAPAWSDNHSAPITGDAREPRPSLESHELHIKTNSF